jgi:hypothetical protein
MACLSRLALMKQKNLTVRIGSGERVLKPGIYNYEIRYQISNHFSRFPEWDELYWNVTGNDWAWPISKASFRLELPDAAGNLNADAKDARCDRLMFIPASQGRKNTTRRCFLTVASAPCGLWRGEGLTVVYTWPRSILADAPAPEAALPLVHLLIPT